MKRLELYPNRVHEELKKKRGSCPVPYDFVVSKSYAVFPAEKALQEYLDHRDHVC